MSVVAVTLVLGALVVLLRTARLGMGSTVVCILFGVVLATTPAGPTVRVALDSSGSWLWGQVSDL